MSVQSIGNSLTPQEIQQLLQSSQLGNADADGTSAATADPTSTDGQNLPTGTNTQDDSASAAPPVTSGQSTLDPKMVLALLKIQEGQQQAQEDSLIFGSSGSTGDPLLDALNSQDQSGTDFGQSILDSLNLSAATTNDISNASQQLLSFLNSAETNTPTATETQAAAAAPAEEE